MSEWWTYTLSDFLLFSSRTYYRLFEIYNAAIWPAQLAGAAAGIAIVALLRRGTINRGRAISALLAVCWTWVAVVFLAGRYTTINWAAIYFAWAFGAEAALWIWIGVVRGRLTFDWPGDLATRGGFALLLFALAALPLAGPFLGRGWRGLQVFGSAPDPTAVATLGVLLLARGRGRGPLMAVPVLWCAVTGLTLLAMKSPEAWIPPFAALLFAALAILNRRRNPAKR